MNSKQLKAAYKKLKAYEAKRRRMVKIPPTPKGEKKATCEACIPRAFYGNYKDVLLCSRHLELESQNESLRKEVSDLKSLIGRERDEFGKRETELMAKLAVAREALERIHAGSYDEPGPSSCARKALANLNDEASGKEPKA